jgi:hypothetical protein
MEVSNTHYFKAIYKPEGDQIPEYVQGEDDRSLFVKDKNAFYDVFYNPWKPLELLQRFELWPASGQGSIYAVDLTDGHFEINGVPFFQHNTVKPDKNGNDTALVLRNFRLIYRRIVNAHATVRTDSKRMTVESLELAGYILGFQANDQDDENHTHFIRT